MNSQMVATQPRRAATAGAPGRPFHVWMATGILIVTFAGFGSRYFLALPAGRLDLPGIVHAHAAVCTAWLLLLLVQSALVSTGRIRLHRRLGVVGGALALAIVGFGLAVALRGARTGWNPGGPFRSPLEFLIVPMTDITLFGAFVGWALHYRHRPELHRRRMVLATVGGLHWPAITRIPAVRGNLVAMLAVLALFVVASPVRDLLGGRRPHRVDLCGGLIVLASLLLLAFEEVPWQCDKHVVDGGRFGLRSRPAPGPASAARHPSRAMSPAELSVTR